MVSVGVTRGMYVLEACGVCWLAVEITSGGIALHPCKNNPRASVPRPVEVPDPITQKGVAPRNRDAPVQE